ncbi:MAG: holo-ACP synthase [Lactovum sp.]
MIVGIGIDNVEILRIKSAMENVNFIKKLLTKKEERYWQVLPSENRKVEFLAGRWAAKEAFSKALGTGIGSSLSFQDLEIENDNKGNPEFVKSPLLEQSVHLSISHTALEAIAFVIIEEKK